MKMLINNIQTLEAHMAPSNDKSLAGSVPKHLGNIFDMSELKKTGATLKKCKQPTYLSLC